MPAWTVTNPLDMDKVEQALSAGRLSLPEAEKAVGDPNEGGSARLSRNSRQREHAVRGICGA